ncbi:DUF397 domain-containing protein [Streptomyces sp. NPDC023838]|uniref:DUF397 domain-containing protein n=1 Tax=Streptomyces sp. NPDC023838 TaxID=3154325 RepID=UPI0033DB9EF6
MPELKWLKSSYSEASGNSCVEVATVGDSVSIRDSKQQGPVLTTSRAIWSALVQAAKAHTFEPPAR